MELFPSQTCESPISKDETIFCVADYIGNPICKRLTCALCKLLFVTDSRLPEYEMNVGVDSTSFNMMTQGSLSYFPSKTTCFYLSVCSLYSVLLKVQESPLWFDCYTVQSRSCLVEGLFSMHRELCLPLTYFESCM